MYRNAFHGLLLLIALYGSWDAVESAMQSPEDDLLEFADVRKKRCAGGDRTDERRRLYERSIALLPETIRLYEDFQQRHPELSHTAIKHLLPEANKFAVTVDRLKEHGVNPKPNKNEPEHMATTDASAAVLIEQRWHEFIEADVSFQITADRLLLGHTMYAQRRRPSIQARTPLLHAALEKFVETRAMFLRRRLRAYARAGLLPHITAENIDTIETLTQTQLEYQYNAARKRERKVFELEDDKQLPYSEKTSE
jgi:hypothetical protein